MTTKYKTLGLSLILSLTTLTSVGHAASLEKSVKNDQTILITDKQSPIGKALLQQKRDRLDNRMETENDQLKMLTSMNNAPTQNFLAEQHQRFSRLFQALFQPHSS